MKIYGLCCHQNFPFDPYAAVGLFDAKNLKND